MYKNLAAMLVAACFIFPAFPQSPPLKIGFVYVAPLTEAGHEVLAAGKTLSDEQILGMNFLVQGVQGTLN